MAPDVNSLPTSPRPDRPSTHRTPSSNNPSNTASRRTSAVIMGPPTQPASATATSSNTARSPVMSSSENNVPMRHPRPLTAAELYAECEKEQEAVVSHKKDESV